MGRRASSRCRDVIVVVAGAAIATSLCGCGGGGGGGGNTTTTTTIPPGPTTTTTTTSPGPLHAIAYGALPVKDGKFAHGRPSADMVQAGYEMQWGAKGRDDLANIKAMGANAVRLYHSLGLETEHDHSGFLDRALEVGIGVMPGMHSDQEDIRLAHKCGKDWNCFNYVKGNILAGLKKQGYARDGKWHPAIRTFVLLNEPDFLDQFCPDFESHSPVPDGKDRWCSNKVILSSFDGLLAAEKEAGIDGTIGVSACMSLAERTSLDGKVHAPGIFGFQDMDLMTKDPSLAKYTPTTSQKDLRAAFESRWEHCVNVPTPWKVTLDAYNNFRSQGFTFGNRPWFLGECAFAHMSDAQILEDMKTMDADARSRNGNFLGFGFFQFETAYWKTGDYEKQFGMFGLGDKVIGQTDDVCNDGGFYFYSKASCATYPVYCLKVPQSGEYGVGRAALCAKGFGGSVDKVKTCGNDVTSATLV